MTEEFWASYKKKKDEANPNILWRNVRHRLTRLAGEQAALCGDPEQAPGRSLLDMPHG